MMEDFLEPVPKPLRNPNYMEIFSFERNFELNEWRIWMSRHWSISVHLAFAYAVLIHLGQIWMKSRRPYRLQLMLTVWNIALAAFSLAGFLRSLPEILHIWRLKGVYGGFFAIICSRENYNTASAFWALVGTISKAAELGDTLFIVLRKSPLIFLHWYHHATVMLYTWYTYEAQDPCHRLFIVMNYGIHAVMYTYYALRAMQVKVPKKISMVITTMQLLQMVIGCVLNAYSYYILKVARTPCDRLEKNVNIATAMYFSYLILFAHFFYNNYLKQKPATHKDQQPPQLHSKPNKHVKKSN